MLGLLLDKAFEFLEIERAELNVFAFNTPAIRTYERVGFVKEGMRRSSTRVGLQRWDTVVMSLLRDEWRNRTSFPGESKPGR